ncbi:MAG: hypothetical protein AAFV53_32200 [Myxococcota bacterium]
MPRTLRPFRTPPRTRLFGVVSLLLAFSLACVNPGATHRRVGRIERKVDQILDNQQVIEGQLDELLQIARAQGTGEITLFFRWNSARLPSSQQQRLVRFLDHLARQSRGRPLLIVSVASADDWGSEAWNLSLSERRANAPRYYVSRHLMHQPHSWHKVQGYGSEAAPEHSRGAWRHVRLIAVYDPAQLPLLPD